MARNQYDLQAIGKRRVLVLGDRDVDMFRAVSGSTGHRCHGRAGQNRDRCH